MIKIRYFFIFSLFALSACDRDSEITTATLSVTNNYTQAAWSVYVAPASSVTEQSMDLLGSVALNSGATRSLSINTCGQALNVQVRFSDGHEQSVTSAAAVNCDSSYSCIIDVAGLMVCN